MFWVPGVPQRGYNLNNKHEPELVVNYPIYKTKQFNKVRLLTIICNLRGEEKHEKKQLGEI